MQEISILCDDIMYNGTSLKSLDVEAANSPEAVASVYLYLQ